MEYAALILGIISLIGSIIGTTYSVSQQKEHDKEMAQVNLENSKKIMDYQNELTQSTNTIATQSGHAAAAGFSPALMYGSMSTPSLVTPSPGGNTGNSSQLEPLRLFDKVPTSNVVETALTKRSQDIQIERNQSLIAKDRQETLESASRTAENMRNTKLQKRLEQTIVDQALSNLYLSDEQRKNLEFLTRRGQVLLPGELESQNLINQETSAKIQKVFSDISHNSWCITEIQHNIKRIDSMTELNSAEKNSVMESVRKTALGRVMQEFGLTKRLTPSQLRNSNVLHNALNNEQMKGAYITLRNLGFSEHEASNAVIYYVAEDAKDVSPSILNSASRIFSALVLKK